MKQQLAFKNRLKEFCREVIEHRMAFTRELMNAAQLAANAEEKSSVGDKYETSRAMNQLDKDMHARQLIAHQAELARLVAIRVDVLRQAVVPGSCVLCGGNLFFVAAGLGRQLVDNQAVIFLSPQAPIAKLLMGKQQGDVVAIGGNEVRVMDVY